MAPFKMSSNLTPVLLRTAAKIVLFARLLPPKFVSDNKLNTLLVSLRADTPG